MADLKTLGTRDLCDTIAVLVGTRPGIIMFAPIIRCLQKRKIPFLLIHAGQHYSHNMDEQFFEELNLPRPNHHLHTVAQYRTHGAQTAEMLCGIENILLEERPGMLLVNGDANTNLAGALAARKLGIGVGHVEAGERSFDWRMPEEHNRRMIDHISNHLYVTGEKAKRQLEKEHVLGDIFVTGNPIIDTLSLYAEQFETSSQILAQLKLDHQHYIVLTTHREENVDHSELLKNILDGVSQLGVAAKLSVVFLMHPRTAKRLHEFGLWDWAHQLSGLRFVEAVGYRDCVTLMRHCRMVVTDSGGVQQEACALSVPAITVRDNTEWTETLEIGANRLVGTDPMNIVKGGLAALSEQRTWSIPFGDGQAAERIVNYALDFISQQPTL